MRVSKVDAMGAYAAGILDAAESRGVLTPSAIQTLVNGLVQLHGGNIPREQDEPVVPQPGTRAGSAASSIAAMSDVVAAAAQK